MLEGEADPLRLRAAELLFRPQQVTINDGAVMAADAETVEMFANSGGFGSLGRLVAEAQTPLRTVELDVLNEDNAGIYWSRDSRYDTVLNLNFAGAGLDARSEEHTSELQSLMRISYADLCLKKK